MSDWESQDCQECGQEESYDECGGCLKTLCSECVNKHEHRICEECFDEEQEEQDQEEQDQEEQDQEE